LEQDYDRKLEEEKKALKDRLEFDKREKERRDERQRSEEIMRLTTELEYEKKRAERERQDLEDLEKRFQDKMKAIKEEFEEELTREKQRINQELSLKYSQSSEKTLNDYDREKLKEIERELKRKEEQEMKKIREEFDLKKLMEEQKLKQEVDEKLSREIEGLEKRHRAELERFRNDIEIQAQNELEEYKKMKEREINEKLKRLETELEREFEVEKKQLEVKKLIDTSTDKDIFNSEKLMKLQRDLISAESEKMSKERMLAELKDEERALLGEVEKLSRVMEDYKLRSGVQDVSIIDELRQQIKETDEEIARVSLVTPDKVDRLEAEIQELKHIIMKSNEARSDEEVESIKPNRNKDSLNQWRSSLDMEKKELRAIQKLVEKDREKWNKDMQEYKRRPNDQRRKELKAVKRILDKQVQRHNERLRDLKRAEEMLHSRVPEESYEFGSIQPDSEILLEDEERILEKWRESRDESVDMIPEKDNWAYRPLNPPSEPKYNVYHRQWTRMAKQRDTIREAINRHGNWLTDMKSQITRAINYNPGVYRRPFIY
jgi:hypothetical protein